MRQNKYVTNLALDYYEYELSPWQWKYIPPPWVQPITPDEQISFILQRLFYEL